MMNGTIQSIHRRHSVRSFREDPVPPALLETLLAAANQAPSAHNQQSWRFVVIRSERKKALADLVAARASGFPRPSAVLLRLAARSIAGAPVVIAVANTGELIAHGTRLFAIEREQAHDFFRTMEIQSSAAAVENLLLAAVSLGLGAVWLGILFLLKDEVLALLGEPRGEFMAVIPVGYPEREAKGPGKKPLEAIVRYVD